MLLVGNEHRGNDATGMAFSQADGSVQVLKEDCQAWAFTRNDKYEAFINEYLKPDTWGVILHTRGATTGSPRINENNHPLYSGKCAAVHNGMIGNHDSLFKSLDIKRGAETDSDIIRGIVDKFGFTHEGIKTLSRMSGSVASAIVSPEYPKHMLLLRSGSPMCLACTEKQLIFSSEKNTIHKALKPTIQRYKMWFQIPRADAAFAPFPDHSAWLIGPEGQEWHQEFRSLMGAYSEPFRRTYTDYRRRQERWDDEQRQVNNRHRAVKQTREVYCPKCDQNWMIPVGDDIQDFTCNVAEKGCGGPLTEVPTRR